MWRTAVLAIFAALVQVGLLTQAQVEAIDGWLLAALPLVSLVLPLAGALWARRRTLPTDTELSAPVEVIRGVDGVYRTRPEDRSAQLTQRADRRSALDD